LNTQPLSFEEIVFENAGKHLIEKFNVILGSKPPLIIKT